MKFYLYKLRINSQGYAADGRYFGVNHGKGDVYEYASADADPPVSRQIRAQNRDQAKSYVQSVYPGASFFR